MGTLGQFSLPPDPSSSNIELSGMVNKNEYSRDYTDHQDYDERSDDEDDADADLGLGDEGSRALLGTQERTRGKERIQWKNFRNIWSQIRGIVVESAPTLLFTTVGLLFTGELLEEVSHWRAMREVDQLIMIIPVVLNLKGNIEMNLSARLSTAANVGELDDPPKRNKIIKGNMLLLQVQAAAVSFLAACIALILGLVIPPSAPAEHSISLNSTDVTNTSHLARFHSLHYPRRPLPSPPLDRLPRHTDFNTFIVIASTAMTAASLSGVFLGSFMCSLVILCRKWGLDPDNIAPAVASCLGDLVTLSLIGLVSKTLIPFKDTLLPFCIATIVLGAAIFCLMMTFKNSHVKDLVGQGWTPLIGAMIISCGTGIILDLFVSRYEDFALLAILISGLPGAVGAILISRLSTILHAAALAPGFLMSHILPQHHNGYESHPPTEHPPITPSPTDEAAKTQLPGRHPEPSTKLVMITLLTITIPVEIIFLSILRGSGWLNAPLTFVVLSICFFCCAVTISFLVAYKLTHWLWSMNRDPDMYALPIHSAMMDLVGQLLLVFCFEIASLLGAQVRSRAR